MVSKDQAIGALILIVCIVVLVVYLAALFFPIQMGNLVGLKIMDPYHAVIWLLAIPVVIAVIVVLGIGAWIGWTMATTPPPKPIEETELEEKEEEKKE